ncbi:MAG: hypothetical protein EZS28_018210 [Streblomastix strix]|uniref:Integrase SAM-like N-terminal domain-containing protein n=1 Tax=Streblomastix strix TaxID=222440 RepID=A0A5J4VV45_9EUKA|nr:MAG: hypothetical protein EZS28_018210 [Streblomastix strix]
MVHTFTNRQLQIPFSCIKLSESELGDGDDEKEGHANSRKNLSTAHGTRVKQNRKQLKDFLDNVIMTREIQQMIIDVQKFNIQRKYVYTMGAFDDWMKEKNYTIEDIMNKNIPFTHTEFMTWLTRTKNTKPSSAKHHTSILNSMPSLIFGTVQVPATVQRLKTCAISNHLTNNPQYGRTWDINQLHEYWRE